MSRPHYDWLLLLASAGFACMSTALFRHVLKGAYGWQGSVSLLLKDTASLFIKPMFLLALGVFVVANVLWLLVLATQKLSIAYPVQIALVIVFNAVISVRVFGESISISGMFGLSLVLAGVILILR